MKTKIGPKNTFSYFLSVFEQIDTKSGLIVFTGNTVTFSKTRPFYLEAESVNTILYFVNKYAS